MTGAPIFLYGTLLDPRVLARHSGDARLARRRLAVARLAGYRRVTFRGTPYPTLLRATGSVVEGRLLRPTPAVLRRLARYEGPGYQLCPVLVQTPGGPLRARAWLTPRWRADSGRDWAGQTASAAAARIALFQAPATVPARR